FDKGGSQLLARLMARHGAPSDDYYLIVRGASGSPAITADWERSRTFRRSDHKSLPTRWQMAWPAIRFSTLPKTAPIRFTLLQIADLISLILTPAASNAIRPTMGWQMIKWTSSFATAGARSGSAQPPESPACYPKRSRSKAPRPSSLTPLRSQVSHNASRK